MKAVFLDRDGIINLDFGFVTSPEEFLLNEGIFDLLRYIREKGYLMIVVSNQGGIAKDLYSMEDVEAIHAKMNGLLNREGLGFDEIYYCTHHPDIGKCICRKPDTVLFEKAIARFGIDPSVSYFIGDRETDEEAGKKAGLTVIRVKPNIDVSEIKTLIS